MVQPGKYRKCKVKGVDGICRFWGLEGISVPVEKYSTRTMFIKKAMIEFPDGTNDYVCLTSVQFLDRTLAPKEDKLDKDIVEAIEEIQELNGKTKEMMENVNDI